MWTNILCIFVIYSGIIPAYHIACYTIVLTILSILFCFSLNLLNIL